MARRSLHPACNLSPCLGCGTPGEWFWGEGVGGGSPLPSSGVRSRRRRKVRCEQLLLFPLPPPCRKSGGQPRRGRGSSLPRILRLFWRRLVRLCRRINARVIDVQAYALADLQTIRRPWKG